MNVSSDLIILGGGCSGLSLGMNLARLGGSCPRTVILESRTHYANDRTWCFWGGFGCDSEQLATRRWGSFSISTATDRVTRRCNENPYLMVSSKDFYDAALREITQVPQIRLNMGTPVEGDVVKRNGLWHVVTEKGEYSAPWILDTRPGANPPDGSPTSHQPTLWQSFLGKEITVGEDLFDEGCAELMNFSESNPESILFLYVLPYSKREALVEATVFGPQPMGAADLEQPFRTLAQHRLNGSPQTTGRTEHGILPMGVPVENLKVDPTYVRAGLMAGGARPSSGYAFQRIWRWSQACTSALAEGRPPIPHPRDTTLTRAMDSLFLRVLRTHPELAPDLFLTLFSKIDPARMARFMSDRGTLADCAAIISSLPSSPFLQELPGAVAAALGRTSGNEKSSR